MSRKAIVKISRNRAVSLLDSAFSKYIRMRGAWLRDWTDPMGFTKPTWVNRCCTCNRVMPITMLQAGHYIKRDKMQTRFSEDNVHPQCAECNETWGLNGNYQEYARFLVEVYGADKIEELTRRSRGQEKIPTYRLIEMISEYKQKVKEMKNERN